MIIQIRSKIWTWAYNSAEEIENTHTHTFTSGENLDLSKEGDIQNYNIFNFKRKRELEKNPWLYILVIDRSVLVCLHISTREIRENKQFLKQIKAFEQLHYSENYIKVEIR